MLRALAGVYLWSAIIQASVSLNFNKLQCPSNRTLNILICYLKISLSNQVDLFLAFLFFKQRRNKHIMPRGERENIFMLWEMNDAFLITRWALPDGWSQWCPVSQVYCFGLVTRQQSLNVQAVTSSELSPAMGSQSSEKPTSMSTAPLPWAPALTSKQAPHTKALGLGSRSCISAMSAFSSGLEANLSPHLTKKTPPVGTLPQICHPRYSESWGRRIIWAQEFEISLNKIMSPIS